MMPLKIKGALCAGLLLLSHCAQTVFSQARTAPLPVPRQIHKFRSPGQVPIDGLYVSFTGGTYQAPAKFGAGAGRTFDGPFVITLGYEAYYVHNDVSKTPATHHIMKVDTAGQASMTPGWGGEEVTHLSICTFGQVAAGDTVPLQYLYAVGGGNLYCLKLDGSTAAWTKVEQIQNVKLLDMAPDGSGFFIDQSAAMHTFSMDKGQYHAGKLLGVDPATIDLARATHLSAASRMQVGFVAADRLHLGTVTSDGRLSVDTYTLTPSSLAGFTALEAIQVQMNTDAKPVNYFYLGATSVSDPATTQGYFAQPMSFVNGNPTKHWALIPTFGTDMKTGTPFWVNPASGELSYIDASDTIVTCNPATKFYLGDSSATENGIFQLPNALCGLAIDTAVTLSFYTDADCAQPAPGSPITLNIAPGTTFQYNFSVNGGYPLPILSLNYPGTALLIDLAFNADGGLVVGEIVIDPVRTKKPAR